MQPVPAWGLMIAEAKNYKFFSLWLIAIPGTALAVPGIAINMVGDGIRDVGRRAAEADVVAPRSRGGGAHS
jgi:ABC-type dipeptide/oligopeptide/nickel transport system permease subunit